MLLVAGLAISVCPVTAFAQSGTREQPQATVVVQSRALELVFNLDDNIVPDENTGLFLVARPRACQHDADVGCLPRFRILFSAMSEEWDGTLPVRVVLLDENGNPVIGPPKKAYWTINPNAVSARDFMPRWSETRPPARLRGPFQLRFVAEDILEADTEPFVFVTP